MGDDSWSGTQMLDCHLICHLLHLSTEQSLVHSIVRATAPGPRVYLISPNLAPTQRYCLDLLNHAVSCTTANGILAMGSSLIVLLGGKRLDLAEYVPFCWVMSDAPFLAVASVSSLCTTAVSGRFIVATYYLCFSRICRYVGICREGITCACCVAAPVVIGSLLGIKHRTVTCFLVVFSWESWIPQAGDGNQ